MSMTTTLTRKTIHPIGSFFTPLVRQLEGRSHSIALLLYVALIGGHFIEHIIQLVQVYILHMPRAMSMGLLGIYLPHLMHSEVLHFSYNLAQLLGLLLLAHGIHASGQKWWRIAIVLQTWHFFEHSLLQAQWVSGYYLFGAAKQTSLGELVLPRVELHFMYVTLAVAPTVIGLLYHLAAKRGQQLATAD